MILGNHTCSQSTNEILHLCLAKYRLCFALTVFRETCVQFFIKLVLLEPCNFPILLTLNAKHDVDYSVIIKCFKFHSFVFIVRVFSGLFAGSVFAETIEFT